MENSVNKVSEQNTNSDIKVHTFEVSLFGAGRPFRRSPHPPPSFLEGSVKRKIKSGKHQTHVPEAKFNHQSS